MKAAGNAENVLSLPLVWHRRRETLRGSISQRGAGPPLPEPDSSSSRHHSESHGSFHPSPWPSVSGDLPDLVVVRS